MSTSVTPTLTLPAAPADNRFRLLLVQDDLDAARLILGFLGRTGFECFYAGDSEAALTAISELKPHLLLTQNEGERIDGGALCRFVREKSGIPIVIFGPGDEAAEVAAFKIGADDYMPSPLRPAILMARVVASLRRAYRYNAAPAKADNPFGLAMDEEETEGVLPSGWARCDTCGYAGPRLKFEREDMLGDIKMRCPNCNSTEHVVISLD
ncbi:Response regulator receiver domain-containing protein [Abditibacterium utsteinense]|uniref:Response regulator receiver domain-containing protein n=1 Tax=Abditibacterium utsteinense TaxID=1960156 RepID=A0A2S8SP22_9BACT|nr:response regulator [Abditibacterium utsteinense]PQV62540.1 Response regulator receiver domain-containing protein [Abditibacterium utsteinense]